MSDAKLLSVDANLALASWRALFICIWRNDTTPEGVQKTWDCMKAFAATQPSGFGLVTIVEPDAPMPDSKPRDRLAALLRSFSSEIKGSALVFEGQGFKAAAVRSVVTGLNLLAKQPYPNRVFDSVAMAARWLPSQLVGLGPDKITGPGMELALQQLRLGIEPSKPEQRRTQTPTPDSAG